MTMATRISQSQINQLWKTGDITQYVTVTCKKPNTIVKSDDSNNWENRQENYTNW